MKLFESEGRKTLQSENINYLFNKKTGLSIVYGENKEDDPDYSPYGPFIMDIEITTICKGINNVPCKFCYKGNTLIGNNMSFDVFKKIFDKLPHQFDDSGKKIFLTQQVAMGVDSQCISNPDANKIFNYCRDNGVIPNITVADITEEKAKELASVMGAVAVSHYPKMYNGDNLCFNSVKYLTDAGLKQVNIHQLLAKETLDDVYQLLQNVKTDDRLKGLNAVVFLSLKKVGRGKRFNSVSQSDYNDIVKYCIDNNIKFGFDSCGCFKFLNAVKDHDDFKKFEQMAEPCESLRFSGFINVDGNFFPCSFLDEKNTVDEGLDILNCNNFIDDIWNNMYSKIFRDSCIDNMRCKRGCPIYNI